MLFDLFLIAKVSIKIKYPKKILLFIENLCYCSLKISGASKNCRLKIAVCIPKIPIGRKKLKIPVRARMYARVYVLTYDCPDSTGHTTSTPTDTEHHRNTRPSEKRGTQDNRHIYVFSYAMKKSIKKVKKNLELRKKVVTL